MNTMADPPAFGSQPDRTGAVPAPRLPRGALDPYRFPGLRGLGEDEDPSAQDSHPHLHDRVPPSGRPPALVSPEDRRRLELQACLTAAGITLLADDPHAIGVLAGVDEITYQAVRRWIGQTH